MAWEGGRLEISNKTNALTSVSANTIHDCSLPPNLIQDIKRTDTTLATSPVFLLVARIAGANIVGGSDVPEKLYAVFILNRKTVRKLVRLTEVGSTTTLGSPLYGTTSVILRLVPGIWAGAGESRTL